MKLSGLEYNLRKELEMKITEIEKKHKEEIRTIEQLSTNESI